MSRTCTHFTVPGMHPCPVWEWPLTSDNFPNSTQRSWPIHPGQLFSQNSHFYLPTIKERNTCITCVLPIELKVWGWVWGDRREGSLSAMPVSNLLSHSCLCISSYNFCLIKLWLISSEYFVGMFRFPLTVWYLLGNHQNGKVQWFSLSFTGTQERASGNIHLLPLPESLISCCVFY